MGLDLNFPFGLVGRPTAAIQSRQIIVQGSSGERGRKGRSANFKTKHTEPLNQEIP